jgi:hypothetical protein
MFIMHLRVLHYDYMVKKVNLYFVIMSFTHLLYITYTVSDMFRVSNNIIHKRITTY